MVDNSRFSLRDRALAVIALLTSCVALNVGYAQDYDLSWYTIDSGGVMWSVGGGFELGGTIGQPDAGATAMTGGMFELVGGFWAAPPCWCMSDLNNDGLLDGLDVQDFVGCMLGGGVNCACADLDHNGLLNSTDVSTFVSGLLVGGDCP